MKKYIVFLLSMFMIVVSGCTIDYKPYFAFYGDDILNGETPDGQTPPGGTENPGGSVDGGSGEGTSGGSGSGTSGGSGSGTSGVQTTLMSNVIPDGVLSYPNSNSTLIGEYGEIYSGVTSQYEVHSSYYSTQYDTLYIAYDKIGENNQTLDARDLALIEEHILYYFESDANKSEYRDYIKVIRIYSDYASSACRSGFNYAQIMGCADYDQVSAAINLNGVNSMNEFLNDTMGYQPKRDTFAHEYGHVSTYYHMILKNRGNYEEYLKIRLGNQYDIIYSIGLLKEYYSDDTYYIQPAEILADDYVDMYYNVSQKAATDTNDYDIAYTDTRNSLTGTNAIKDLNTDAALFAKVKAYYDNYLNKEETKLTTPKVVTASGKVYGSIKAVSDNHPIITLSSSKAIVISQVTINGQKYYKIILSNIVKHSEHVGDLRDYTKNVGYILVTNCQDAAGTVIKFTKFNGTTIASNLYIPFNSYDISGLPYDVDFLPHYEFSYFVDTGGKLELYNLFDSSFGIKKFSSSQFK